MNAPYRDLMVDIETLSTRRDAMIVAIGAVWFCAEGLGGAFHGVIEARKSSGHIDPGTVAWWMRQSDEARAIFAVSGGSLFEVLTDFVDFIGFRREGLRVWCHGAGFDVPIIEAAMERELVPIPWTYRAIRDTRTILDLADVRIEGPEAERHDALGDARAQALAVIKAADVLGRERLWPGSQT